MPNVNTPSASPNSSTHQGDAVHPLLAKKMASIAPFHVMALLDKAKALQAAGEDIIHLEVGEPDFPTPEPIVEAGIQALRDGHTHYTSANGLPQLREAISNHYAQRYQVTVNPKQIMVTPGASGALFAALSILINPGDTVSLADPGYPCNRNFIEILGGRPYLIPVTETSNFQLSPSLIEQHWQERTKALLIASPSNPTGTLLNADDLQSMIRRCQQHQAAAIVDEIYQGLTYNDSNLNDPTIDHTALSTAPHNSSHLFVLNSFSKYFGMTGWRVGWMVAPEWAIEPLEKVAQNLFIAAPTHSQYAALAAFKPETSAIIEAQRIELKARRDYLLPALQSLGFKIACKPEGAFYLYADIGELLSGGSEKSGSNKIGLTSTITSTITSTGTSTGTSTINNSYNSYDFCQRLLTEAGVAITPGCDFGTHRADQMVRFAYTATIDRLEEAVERIRTFLRKS